MWKGFIDGVFSLWNISVHEIEEFIHIRQTASIKQSSLQLEFWKQKLHSWTQKCTKVTHFTRNLSLTCKHTTNPRRPFNTRISIRVTHQASREDLPSGKLFLKASANKFLSFPLSMIRDSQKRSQKFVHSFRQRSDK